MLREHAAEYRSTAAALIIEAPKATRRAALSEIQTDPDYLVAKMHSQAARDRAFIVRGFAKTLIKTPVLESITEEPAIAPERPDTVEWANQVAEAYASLPKSTRKEKERAARYLKEATFSLLVNPENIPSAVLIWKNTEDKDPAYKKFYADARISMEENARLNWRTIPEDKLGALLKVASHDKATADFSKSALKGYFRGGQAPEDVVTARYKFASGLVSLGPDYQSLKLGYNIAIHKESEILPLAGTAGINYQIAAGVRLDNKADMRKSVSLSAVWNIVSRFLGANYATDIGESVAKVASIVPQKRLISEMTQVIKKLGQKRTFEFLADLQQSLPVLNEGMEALLATPKSPLLEYIGLDLANDPLLQKTNNSLNAAGGYYTESAMFTDAKAKFPGQPLKTHYFPVGGRLFGYTIVPVGLTGQELAAIEDEVITSQVTDPSAYLATTANGTQVVYNTGEPLSPVRGQDFASLATVGIPVLTVNGELPTLATTGELSADLYEKQRVFLDKRGVKIDLKGLDAYTSQGFRSLIFKRSDSGIDVSIKGDGFSADTSLDKYFTLKRSEGFSSPLGEESLYLLMLKALSGILSKEAQNGGTEHESAQLREVIARMSHLRLLPLGQNSSEEAKRLYKVEQKLDLSAKSAQIKAENASDPAKADRNTTYVQAVRKEGHDQLPPVELSILKVLDDSIDIMQS